MAHAAVSVGAASAAADGMDEDEDEEYDVIADGRGEQLIGDEELMRLCDVEPATLSPAVAAAATATRAAAAEPGADADVGERKEEDLAGSGDDADDDDDKDEDFASGSARVVAVRSKNRGHANHPLRAAPAPSAEGREAQELTPADQARLKNHLDAWAALHKFASKRRRKSLG